MPKLWEMQNFGLETQQAFRSAQRMRNSRFVQKEDVSWTRFGTVTRGQYCDAAFSFMSRQSLSKLTIIRIQFTCIIRYIWCFSVFFFIIFYPNPDLRTNHVFIILNEPLHPGHFSALNWNATNIAQTLRSRARLTVNGVRGGERRSSRTEELRSAWRRAHELHGNTNAATSAHTKDGGSLHGEISRIFRFIRTGGAIDFVNLIR